MIFTIGHRKSYEQYFADAASQPFIDGRPKKLGRCEDYVTYTKPKEGYIGAKLTACFSTRETVEKRKTELENTNA